MDPVIVFVAQYLLFIMAAGFAVYWLAAESWPDGKIRLGATAGAGLVLTLAFIYAGSKLHTDPRPFVQDPSLKPMFPHPADNGFPSDHSAAAGLIAALVLWRSRAWGVLFGVAAVLVAAARVLSHVHHLQDVAAGLAFGIAAFLIAWYAVRLALAALARRQVRIRLPLIGDLNLAGSGHSHPNGLSAQNGQGAQPGRPRSGRHAAAANDSDGGLRPARRERLVSGSAACEGGRRNAGQGGRLRWPARAGGEGADSGSRTPAGSPAATRPRARPRR